MNNKVQGLEKELELERRKLRELQDSARERDKEYQKLKVRGLRDCLSLWGCSNLLL